MVHGTTFVAHDHLHTIIAAWLPARGCAACLPSHVAVKVVQHFVSNRVALRALCCANVL